MISEVLLLNELDADLAEHCAKWLCKLGSEMQREFRRHNSLTPLALTYDGDDALPVSWVATHVWRGIQTIEGYTAPDWRRRGIARIGVLMLVSAGHLNKREPLAVFAPECVDLAYGVGFDDVRFFQRDGRGGWLEVRA